MSKFDVAQGQLMYARPAFAFLLLLLVLLLNNCANALDALKTAKTIITTPPPQQPTTIITTTPIATTSTSHLNTSANNSDSELSGKLVFAQVIFRHGDRTPIDPYPTDPWGKREFWPTGWGQLTNIGKNQHYQLGQWLRQRYATLLSPTYTNDEIFVRATDVDRTLMSALSNLAGLYPPHDGDVWNANIDWQPIPVHTVPESLDPVLAGKAPCPAYEYALSSLQNSPEFQKLHKKYIYLFNYLTKYTGCFVDSFDGVQYLNNTLFIEQVNNKTLPDWTHKVYPSADMTFISSFTFSIYTYTRQLARLKIGPLIKEMLERFSAKACGKLDPDRKVWIYSGHDSTIANVLNALKLFDLHSPPYTACILLELRMDEQKNAFVSISYKNTTTDPVPMHIPNCGTSCPLEKMFMLYRDILPDDWKTECQLSTLMITSYDDANMSTALGILVAIISVMLFFSYMITIYYRRHSYRSYFAYAQVA